MPQLGAVAALEAADHRIRLAAPECQCRNDGGRGTHQSSRRIGRDAAAAGHLHIGLHIVAVARIILGVDDLEIRARPDRQAIALDARLDHRRPADQDGPGDPLLQQHFRRAQHALVLAIGIDHPLRRLLRRGKNLPHHEAGAEHEALQPLAIGIEVGDGPRRHAAVHRRLGHRRRHAQDQARVERCGDQRILAEQPRLAAIGPGHHVGRRFAGEACDGVHRRLLHRLVDGGGAYVQRTPEDIGEAENIVHLVRIVRPPGADHRVGPDRHSLLRHDLRVGVGECEDQRVLRHLLQQLRLQHAARRKPEEDVGAGDHISQRARVRVLGEDVLPAVHQLVAALEHHALEVGYPDVLDLGPEADELVQAGECGRPRTARHDLDLGE